MKMNSPEKEESSFVEAFLKLASLTDVGLMALQKAGVDKALRGSDKMTRFARAANSLILSIVRLP